MGDDGEKFGAWPTTWEHCWGKSRWVERFFEAIEANAGWLSTIRPSDWLASNAPIGRVYIPTGSYAEMGEWALPPEESRGFGAALHDARQAGAPEARWLRGAFWRNFQVKYREINDLHKQMLRVSEKVAGMAPGSERDLALDHLYRGQSNDCYWHGLFGGIYIAHMRAATLHHLIAAEDLADTAAGAATGSAVLDLDLDGRDEIRIANAGQTVCIDLDEGAGIGSWDIRAARHALTGVLRRRPEAYHETLREHERQLVAAAAAVAAPVSGASAGGAGDAGEAASGPTSIHDRVQVKEPGLADKLVYDEYERRSGLIRILPASATAASWGAGGRDELGDLATGAFRLVRLDPDGAVVARDGAATIDGRALPIAAETTIRVGDGRREPILEWSATLENRGDRPLVARIGVEWAITMLGGGGNPDAWWEIAGTRTSHDAVGGAPGVERLSQGNGWLATQVDTTVSPAADAWYAPIETVSNSEAGFERVYQGSALLLSWPVNLAPGASWSATIVHRAKVGTDRLAEEQSS
jgi:alpha-amylase